MGRSVHAHVPTRLIAIGHPRAQRLTGRRGGARMRARALTRSRSMRALNHGHLFVSMNVLVENPNTNWLLKSGNFAAISPMAAPTRGSPASPTDASDPSAARK